MSGGGGNPVSSGSTVENGQAQSGMPVYGGVPTTESVANVATPATTQNAQSRYYTSTYQQPSPQQNVQNLGLQALYDSIANQYAPISQQFNLLDQFYQQPQQAQQTSMPVYQNTALQYTPNRAPAEQSLNRVAKSVVLQQKEAAEAELNRLRAEQAAAAAWQAQNSGDSGGGGA